MAEQASDFPIHRSAVLSTAVTVSTLRSVFAGPTYGSTLGILCFVCVVPSALGGRLGIVISLPFGSVMRPGIQGVLQRQESQMIKDGEELSYLDFMLSWEADCNPVFTR